MKRVRGGNGRLYRNEKLWGGYRSWRFRVKPRERSAERSHKPRILEASTHLGMLVGTTDNHLSLLAMRGMSPLAEGEMRPRIWGEWSFLQT